MMRPEELEQIRKMPFGELMGLALNTKLVNRGQKVALCSIINAKSGRCSEDCRFCVQSAHHKTASPVYPLLDRATIVAAAHEAKRIGAEHFSLVTSGRGMQSPELERVADIVATIRREVDIKVCASLGILDIRALTILKDAGLSRYHHNLETSQEYFARVVTTHTFAERLETIRAAQEAGLEVCAGGIFGLGETEDDRVSMALTLAACRVDSVPINILIPLPGTPMAHNPPLSVHEILRAIALVRIILPAVPVRLSAGRETALKDFVGMAFMAGADGMMIGGYLTQQGRLPAEDQQLIEEIKRLWSA